MATPMPNATPIGEPIREGADPMQFRVPTILAACRVQCDQLYQTAIADAHRLKEEYERGDGGGSHGALVLVVLANRSDVELRLVGADFADVGEIWKYPVPFALGPGQIVAMLHVSDEQDDPATGALVFHVDGTAYDVQFGYHVPGDEVWPRRNVTSTELRGSGYWSESVLEEAVEQLPGRLTRMSRFRVPEFESSAAIGGATSAPVLCLTFDRIDD